MPRIQRKTGNLLTNEADAISGLISATIPLDEIIPWRGAKVFRWGLVVAVAGTGTANVTWKLREAGSSIDLAESILLALNAPRGTAAIARGPAFAGGGGLPAVGEFGKGLDLNLTFDAGSATVSQTNYAWIHWFM